MSSSPCAGGIGGDQVGDLAPRANADSAAKPVHDSLVGEYQKMMGEQVLTVDADISRCFVYVIGPDIGPQKIGIATDPKRRLSQYRTHNIQNVDIHFKQTCPRWKAREIEQHAHKSLSDYLHHGEWFEVTTARAIDAVKGAMNQFSQPRTTQCNGDQIRIVDPLELREICKGYMQCFSLESFDDWLRQIDAEGDSLIGSEDYPELSARIRAELTAEERKLWILRWQDGSLEFKITEDSDKFSAEVEERAFGIQAE